jgi:hypothetical protein
MEDPRTCCDRHLPNEKEAPFIELLAPSPATKVGGNRPACMFPGAYLSVRSKKSTLIHKMLFYFLPDLEPYSVFGMGYINRSPFYFNFIVAQVDPTLKSGIFIPGIRERCFFQRNQALGPEKKFMTFQLAY